MIRVGIGGWTFEPWRGAFYPAGLRQADELAHASRQMTSIEINGTFYRTQTPASFRKWAQETPDDFIFAIKGPRYATNRSRLAEALPAIERFVTSGITELGPKLGPISWQFAPTKKFDPEDFEAFLSLLPKAVDGLSLRHAVEVRHGSFKDPSFVDLARRFSVAIVYADHETYPAIADVTADFVYARLMGCAEEQPTGYTPEALATWAKRFETWASGGQPEDLPKFGSSAPSAAPRDCFVYFISGAKVRAPAAAKAFLERLPVS
jgi:uncharacterized protein YecE (DUF72 family)